MGGESSIYGRGSDALLTSGSRTSLPSPLCTRSFADPSRRAPRVRQVARAQRLAASTLACFVWRMIDRIKLGLGMAYLFFADCAEIRKIIFWQMHQT